MNPNDRWHHPKPPTLPDLPPTPPPKVVWALARYRERRKESDLVVAAQVLAAAADEWLP